MQEVRRRRSSLVEGLDERLLDWEGPDGRENAIGILLYHIAEVEMAWLWGGIKGRSQMPPENSESSPSNRSTVTRAGFRGHKASHWSSTSGGSGGVGRCSSAK